MRYYLNNEPDRLKNSTHRLLEDTEKPSSFLAAVSLQRGQGRIQLEGVWAHRRESLEAARWHCWSSKSPAWKRISSFHNVLGYPTCLCCHVIHGSKTFPYIFSSEVTALLDFPFY